jgi:hypothetical protein
MINYTILIKDMIGKNLVTNNMWIKLFLNQI